MTPEIERVIDPEFVAALDVLALDEIRGRRRDAQAVENALSYVRRMVQGRLDIVGGELQRRREGGDPSNISELVYRLPDILGDERPAASAAGARPMARPPLELEPDRRVTDSLERQLDALVELSGDGTLAHIDDAGLLGLADSLATLEHRVSAHRHTLHDVISALQSEITRRYRTGEASVDSLLA